MMHKDKVIYYCCIIQIMINKNLMIDIFNILLQFLFVFVIFFFLNFQNYGGWGGKNITGMNIF